MPALKTARQWHLYRAADLKSCNYGCMGFGSCVKACPFDAIHIVDGIAKVDPEACKACGKCVEHLSEASDRTGSLRGYHISTV